MASLRVRWRGMSDGTKGVLSLSSATATSQIILFLATLPLARLYDPDAFGVFVYVSAIASIVSIAATLRFELAIPAARSDADARGLAKAAIRSMLVAAAALAVAIVLLQALDVAAVGGPSWDFVWLAPILLLLYGAYSIASQVCLRERQYNRLGARSVLQSSVVSIGQLGAAAFTRTAGGLFFGDILGRFIGVVALVRVGHGSMKSEPGSVPGYRETFRRNRTFPLSLTPASLLDAAVTQAPLLMVGAWFGASAAGYVGLASRVLAVPLALVGIAVSQVLLGELAIRVREGNRDNTRIFVHVSRRLLLLAIGSGLTAAILAPWAFTLVFGATWTTAGELARAMAFGAAMTLVWNPVSSVFITYRRLNAFALLSVLRLALTLVAGTIAFTLELDLVSVVFVVYTAIGIGDIVGWLVARKVVSG